MQKEIEITLVPEKNNDENALRLACAEKLGIDSQEITSVRVRKRSIDARGRKVVYRLLVQVFLGTVYEPDNFEINYANVSGCRPVLIVGAGPAGIFAALQCLEKGLKPIVIERGKDVRSRRRDLAALNRLGIVNPESNYCYGEGGAGTYSDGKLYTRANKRGDVQKVLRAFVAHGAPSDILINSRPHIGTNILPHIISAMRNTILAAGGEIHFEKKVIDIEADTSGVRAVHLLSGERIEANHVVLATGHSARDIYELLHKKGWAMESKGFALGVRIEHPQLIIDQAQYHCEVRNEHLPPAYYSLVEQVNGRGVFSFCMCPGGVIAPCATQPGEIVVNGWSPSKRNNPFANSGTVVQINTEDIPGAAENPFAMLEFQRQVEQAAFLAGGGKQVAPAQRMVDFVRGRTSQDLPENSYKPGTVSADLTRVLPGFVTKALQAALPIFGKKLKGYYSNEALLVGVESRTSSPIRIPRDSKTLQHSQVRGLYPCAEGAGYAGGIVSAAIDGMNCIDALSLSLS